MTELFNQICDLFIRPARQQYNLFDLGTPILKQFVGNSIIDSIGRRLDFQLTNPRGLRIKCSYYELLKQQSPTTECVVYLHSLNGSRLQSNRFAALFLEQKISFANFDFSGSGMSQGEFVSLGFHERSDVQAVLERLHEKHGIRKFALWGRSMGAVTALKFSEMNADNKCNYSLISVLKDSKWTICSLVLDSPFSNLNELAIEIAETKVKLPSLLLRAGFIFIKKSIEERAGFEIGQLDVLRNVHKINLPLLVLASQEDTVISCKHSERIYQRYPHPNKELIYVRGGHNCCRDSQLLDKIISFFKKNFESKHKNFFEAFSQRDEFGKPLPHSVKGPQTQTRIEILNKSDTPNNSSPGRKSLGVKLKLINQNNTSFRTHQKPYLEERSSTIGSNCNEKIQLTKNLVRNTDKQINQTVYKNNKTQQDNCTIRLDQRSHFNIIGQKLENMRRKPGTSPSAHIRLMKTDENEPVQSENPFSMSLNQQRLKNMVNANKYFSQRQQKPYFSHHEDEQVEPPKGESSKGSQMLIEDSISYRPKLPRQPKKSESSIVPKSDSNRREIHIQQPHYAVISLKSPSNRVS